MSWQNDSLASYGATSNKEVTVNPGPGGYWVDLQYFGTPAFLFFQNVGVYPVFYRLTANISTAGCGTTSGLYSGVLAAGDAAHDGTGGTLNLIGCVCGVSFNSNTGTSTVNIAYSGRLGE